MGASSKRAVPANRAGTAQLFVFPSRAALLARGGTVPASGHRLGNRFTAADRLAMSAWIGEPGHGYDRLRIECGDGTGFSFALAYVPGTPWSAWGVTRRGDVVEVWRCATGKTVGCYETMAEALAALPPA